MLGEATLETYFVFAGSVVNQVSISPSSAIECLVQAFESV